jgi:hypothetical protein
MASAESSQILASQLREAGIYTIIPFAMNSDSKARFFGLFGLGVFAVWLTAGIGSGFYHCLVSLRWPTTQARITSSQVNTGSSNVGRWWAPAVGYEYEISGRIYQASTIRYLMPHFYQEEPAANVTAPYPNGRDVRISYDPDNPSQSVLEPGVPAGMWKQALIPMFFWGLVALIHFEITHPKRRRLLRSNPEVEESEENEAKAA